MVNTMVDGLVSTSFIWEESLPPLFCVDFVEVLSLLGLKLSLEITLLELFGGVLTDLSADKRVSRRKVCI